MSRIDDHEREPSWRASLAPFPEQRRGRHLLTAAVGAVVWSGTYLALLVLLGGEAVAIPETAAAAEARLLAGLLASVVAGLYFGLAVARERGGPVLNVLYAPIAAAIGAVGLPTFAVYGAVPETAFAAPAFAAQGWGALEVFAVGEVLVFSTAGAVTLGVVGCYLAFFAGPAQRTRIEAGYAPLAAVHAAEPSLADDGSWPADDGVKTGHDAESDD